MLRVVAAAAAAALGAGALLNYTSFGGAPYAVTYDNRSLMLNGQRALFLSAGIHYPRSTPQQWADLFTKAVADGHNQIQTYVFWYAHQHREEDWDFTFQNDLRRFITMAGEKGLFTYLRIGPYICAETQFGGYPPWLTYKPDLVTRTSSSGWEAAMGTFFNRTVAYVRDLFADRGGPIVMAQVENELHTSDTAYIDWCGDLATATGVEPWGMCNGNSAPQTINTCNGGSCTSFIDSNGQNGRVLIDQPALWTEDWLGWYQQWTDGSPPSGGGAGEASGKAAAIAQWFARGGSHHNYYMWAGGNNFGATSGAGTQNQYYWDATISSDGLSNEPVRTHLRNLHYVLSSVADVLLSWPAQKGNAQNLPMWDGGSWQPSQNAPAYVYGTGASAVAFIEAKQSGFALFNGHNITVTGSASVIASGNGTVLFDTSRVPSPPVVRVTTPLSASPLPWQMWSEAAWTSLVPAAAPPSPILPGPTTIGTVARSPGPLEAVNFTAYDTEFVYYTTALTAGQLRAALGTSGATTNLVVQTARASALAVFLNGTLGGVGYELSEAGGGYTMTIALPTSQLAAAAASGGGAVLSILAESMGIHKGSDVNNGDSLPSFSTQAVKGITSNATGSVTLGGVDITLNGWAVTSGLRGEALNAPAGTGALPWVPVTTAALGPLTWLRANFTAPPVQMSGDEVVSALMVDVTGLSRGRLYVNGFSLGRYWTRQCGSAMCQRYYFVPPDVLLPGANANQLVVADVEGITNASAATLAVTVLQGPQPCPAVTAGTNATMLLCAPGMGWTPAAANGGVRLVSGNNTGVCLGIAGTNPTTGAPNVQGVPCNAGDSTQVWSLGGSGGSYGPVTHVASGQCLDIPNQDPSLGNRVETWGCNGGSNQNWAWDATTGYLVAALNNACVATC